MFAWQNTVRVIADEIGLNPEEINEQDEFKALGVNGILSQSIITKLRGTLGKDLPSDIFDQNPTVGAFREYCGGNLKIQQRLPDSSLQAKLSPSSSVSLSTILKNGPATGKQIVFLLPDGSGSGMAYANLPLIHPSVCVVGLNSPYLRSANHYCCSIEEVSLQWVNEIYHRQPNGPYILGGWSAGGYYSFEVAKQLVRDGKRVEKLILIDSPCRTVFESLPMEVIGYLASRNLMGNWGSNGPPTWLVEHFRSTLRAVGEYHPTPMDARDVPETYIVWSRDGVQPKGTLDASGLDLRVKVSQFLLQGKTNFGPNGWDQLLPGREIKISTMSGTHFSMISAPHVSNILF